MSKQLTLEGKVALVQGGSRGIGAAIVRRLAREGAQVAFTYVSSEGPAQALAEEVQAAGGKALALRADSADAAAVQLAVDDTVKAFGRLDILVNNVGGTIWAKPFEHYEVEQIEAEVRRSLFPTLWCCHAALPYMLERGSGAIVNVSSIATRGVNRVPYGAAKGGVNALTACLAFETAGRGIRVNATAPGGTRHRRDGYRATPPSRANRTRPGTSRSSTRP